MTKRSSLSDALHQASRQKHSSVSVAGPTRGIEKVTPIQSVSSNGAVPPSRIGKKLIGGHFDPSVSYQLRRLALEKEASVQKLLGEAINDLFEKYDLPPIA